MELDGAEAWDRRPLEPPPTRWGFPHPDAYGPEDLVAIGGDLEPGTILRAYRQGLFPMHVDRRRLGWWSPVERGVIPLDVPAVPVATAELPPVRGERRPGLPRVIADCAGARRPHGWITPSIVEAYTRLHELGWAHSVEAWTDQGELAGGLYGLRLGGLFAGESMVHLRTDGSKVALVGAVDLLRESGASLLDVQWLTPHLARWGRSPSAEEYLARLEDALGGTAGKPMG